MEPFVVRERIRRPQRQVWAFMADPAHAPAWVPGMVEVRPLAPGPARAGWAFQETRRAGDHEETFEVQVVTWDPPHRYVAEVRVRGGRFVHAYRLEDAGDSTDVEYALESVPEGPVWRMLMAWGFRRIRDADGDLLARLRVAIEGAPAAAADALATPARPG